MKDSDYYEMEKRLEKVIAIGAEELLSTKNLLVNSIQKTREVTVECKKYREVLMSIMIHKTCADDEAVNCLNQILYEVQQALAGKDEGKAVKG